MKRWVYNHEQTWLLLKTGGSYGLPRTTNVDVGLLSSRK